MVERAVLDTVRTYLDAVRAEGISVERAIVFGSENILDVPPVGKAAKQPKGLGPDMSEVDRAFGA